MFGGQQAVSILCSIVRTKLVAMWIGPVGVGLFGIFNSAIATFGNFAQLNLRQTAVREMASAEPDAVASLGHAVRRISLWLGLAGGLLMLILSPWLAEASLGSRQGWPSFAWLAVTIALITVNNGEAAIFQGLKQFRRFTVCLTLGAIGGLVVSVPLFYYWRVDSIIPSIIAFHFVSWICLGLYRRKLPAPDRTMGVKETFRLGRRFLQLGLYMTLSELAVNAINYIFLAYLAHTSDLDTIGIYNAGFTLINRYAGLIFAAISMEYFPRLAAVEGKPRRESSFVANQAIIALAILVPVATTFVACLQPVVELLYSHEFLPVIPMAAFAMTGTALRAVAWCMAYVIVARGDGRIFLITESLSAVVALVLNIVGFRLAGFLGLGLAYTLWYAAYIGIISYVYFRRYKLRLSIMVWRMLGYAVVMTGASGLLAVVGSAWWATPIALVSLVVGWKSLRRE